MNIETLILIFLNKLAVFSYDLLQSTFDKNSKFISWYCPFR